MTNTLVFNNNFVELNNSEELNINAGGILADLGNALAVTGSAILIASSPVVACFCPPAGAAALLIGIGAFGKTTGLY